ncbi:MAG: hypothetical protein F7B59_01240 [Desulfurococcales archaeon]|nr:hypothetical protein [Desulfurococcales archaeon]
MPRYKLLNKNVLKKHGMVEITPYPQTNKTILEGVIESYTPYLGGDFDSQTNKEAITIDEKQKLIYATGYPKPKSIIANMRWITRIAVATVKGLNSYKEAEMEPLPIDILKNDYKNISLTTLLFGATSSQKGLPKKFTAFKGLVSIRLTPVSELYSQKENFILEKDIESSPFNKYNRYSALLRRGKDGKESKIPIKKGFLKFEIALSIDENRLRNIMHLSTPLMKDITDLVKDSFIATVLIFGIGSGVNRGFGRFTFTLTQEDQAKILSYVSDPILFITTLTKNLVNAVASLYKIEFDSQVISSLKNIPLFNRYSMQISAINYHTNVSNNNIYLAAIEKISKYMTKSVLKRDTQQDSLNIHTWILGLPRYVRYTGYLPLRRKEDLLIVIGENCRNLKSKIQCPPNYDPLIYDKEVEKYSSKISRRQSMIIGFPWFSGNQGNVKLILMSMFANDLHQLVFCDKNDCLYHFSQSPRKLNCIYTGVNLRRVLTTDRIEVDCKLFKVKRRVSRSMTYEKLLRRMFNLVQKELREKQF